LKELTELIPSDAYLTTLNLARRAAHARRSGALGVGHHHGAREVEAIQERELQLADDRQGDKERFALTAEVIK
jgi:hypothetical protein